jgi:hypothetical protein
LRRYHSWWLKNTFRVALNGMPKRAEFVQRLAPSIPDASERERIVLAELKECVEVQTRAVELMRVLFTELDLEDTRKA